MVHTMLIFLLPLDMPHLVLLPCMTILVLCMEVSSFPSRDFDLWNYHLFMFSFFFYVELGGESSRGMGKKIFVGRLPQEATADDLRQYFGRFGRILDVYIPKVR